MGGERKTLSRTGFLFCLSVVFVIAIFLAILPNFVVLRPAGSRANTCINNLRNIERAKYVWALENNKSTNESPTWDEIKRYLDHSKSYYKFNRNNDLPVCPMGGIYGIGKVGESPTCSLGTTVTPAHVLPQ